MPIRFDAMKAIFRFGSIGSSNELDALFTSTWPGTTSSRF